MVGGSENAGAPQSGWNPTTFWRLEDQFDTSMGTARIITDAGPAYIKAQGNRQGPHPLACELVATALADWFGLPTFEYAILNIDATVDEIPFLRGGSADSGPAFVAKAVMGHTWGGSDKELANLVNPQDVSKLVVFDTWVRNCDRCPPDLTVRKPNYDNVFLEDLSGKDAGKLRLFAMDHTHCFTCGRDLHHRLATIDRVRDERLYGLFPGFVPLVSQADVEDAVSRLSQVTAAILQPMVDAIPREWEVDEKTKRALVELIERRADFVAATVMKTIAERCWPDSLFDNR